MNPREKADIVEHVAKAMCEHDHGPASSSAWNVHFGQYREVAAPAIRATLEFLRENPTKQMIEAGNDTIHECIDFWNYDSGSGYSVEQHAAAETLRAMLSAALNDIDGGAG